MLENIDYILTQMDFNPDELAGIKRRGAWYAGIGVMALITLGMIALNISMII